MRPLHRFCFSVPLLFFAACGDTAPPPPADEGPAPIVIAGAMLIDGSGAAPIEDSVVVVRGDRIESVVPRSDTALPDGAEVIDGTGKVVIPGLIDLHCHYRGGLEGIAQAFGTQLRFGVTTARSLGSDPEANLEVMARAEAGEIEGPRIYTAGLGFSHPEDGRGQTPESEDEAREQVRALAAQDVDLVKMWVDSVFGTRPKITPEIRAAIVSEAAAHGMPAAAHIYDGEDVRQLADIGVTDFVHSVRGVEVDASFVEYAREKGLSFSPALAQAQHFWYLVENPEELDDPDLREALTPERADQLLGPEGREQMLATSWLEERRADYALSQKFIKTMHDAGVMIAVGSDSGVGNVAFGWGTHHEMRQLVEAGLTPVAAIAAATGNAARVLEGNDAEFGVVAAGKIADLIVLGADPTSDIRNTRRIERVMQVGRWLDR